MNNLPDFPFSSIKQIYRFSLSQFVCTHNLVPRILGTWLGNSVSLFGRGKSGYQIIRIG